MVDIKSVQKQLKHIKFSGTLWNQAEMRELPNILHEGEKIAECANGMYEGGFALLIATDSRVLLVDKKPLNYLTVEDLRFDMITELDYSHRLMGATITISAGSKVLKFKSYNQPRLRKLISEVQSRISEIKKEQSEKTDYQRQHLEEINKQLQMYLLAQHQQLQQQLAQQQAPVSDTPELPKPDPKLADYLFAQQLLEQFGNQNGGKLPEQDVKQSTQTAETPAPEQTAPKPAPVKPISIEELRNDAEMEIFGKHHAQTAAVPGPAMSDDNPHGPAKLSSGIALPKALEVNPLKIAYSKLPMMLRNRKIGRPTLRSYTEQPNTTTQAQPAR